MVIVSEHQQTVAGFTASISSIGSSSVGAGARSLHGPRSAIPCPRGCLVQMRFAPRSRLLIIIPLVVMVVMVVARSSAIAGIIAGMLACVHAFTVGAINFSAVGFSDIFVTLS